MADSLAAPLEILAGGGGCGLVTGTPQGSAALLTSCFENPTEVQGGKARHEKNPHSEQGCKLAEGWAQGPATLCLHMV